jgi:hypothetical protein
MTGDVEPDAVNVRFWDALAGAYGGEGDAHSRGESSPQLPAVVSGSTSSTSTSTPGSTHEGTS